MRSVAMVVAISMAGCGLTMTRGPGHATDPNGRPRCTESMSAPKNDGIGAVLGLVAVVFGGVSLEADNDSLGVPLLVGGLATMAVSYASGAVGYFRVKKCRKAIEEFDRRAPPLQPLAPPPTSS